MAYDLDLESDERWFQAKAAKKSTLAVRPEDGLVAFVESVAGFRLEPAQVRVVEAQSKRVLLNCCRQFGKSTITAGKAVAEALANAGALILVASPGARQSGEFMRKAEFFVSRLGIPVRGDGDNEMSLLFPNGSRIVGLPGNEDTVRGFSAVSLLILDEASRIPDGLYHSLRPSVVAAGGSIWALSTPNGRRGFFWRSWSGDGEEWERVEGPARECSRYVKEDLERERRVNGERVFAQEYECQFVDADDQLLRWQALEGAVREGVRPLARFDGRLLPCFDPDDVKLNWREYIVGVDLGKLRNPSAIAVIEKKSVFTGERDARTYEWRTVESTNVRYLERLPVGLAYIETVKRIRGVAMDPELTQHRNRVELVLDASGVGEAVLEQLRLTGAGCDVLPVTLTGGQSARRENGRWYVPRLQLLMDLAVMLEGRELGIAGGMDGTERLMSELRGFRVMVGERDRVVGGAADDGKDDLAFAVALAAWRARSVSRDLYGRRRVV